jgi:hypothetical protein
MIASRAMPTRFHHAMCAVGAACATLAVSPTARAQDAPWAPEPVAAASASPPDGSTANVSRGETPRVASRAAPPNATAASGSLASPVNAPPDRYGATPDPAFTHTFQMPTARPLRHGDTMITVLGDLGWIGIRYGFTRRFDAGIGIPYYVAGMTVDARYAVVLADHAALSIWGLGTVPFDPGVNDPTSFFGFNWRGGGPGWMLGPVVSLWGARAGFHAGAQAAQRVLMGGLWAMVHMSVDVKIADSVRAIAQGVLMSEVIGERTTGPAARALVGNTQPRIHPYLVIGARVHSRRFAVDFGALMSFAAEAPLAPGTPGIWPWACVSQTF